MVETAVTSDYVAIIDFECFLVPNSKETETNKPIVAEVAVLLFEPITRKVVDFYQSLINTQMRVSKRDMLTINYVRRIIGIPFPIMPPKGVDEQIASTKVSEILSKAKVIVANDPSLENKIFKYWGLPYRAIDIITVLMDVKGINLRQKKDRPANIHKYATHRGCGLHTDKHSVEPHCALSDVIEIMLWINGYALSDLNKYTRGINPDAVNEMEEEEAD